ncbi:hypothetical protein HNP84_001937 [Thermocatellispora tengchongensis]|uniref:Uncharacterized protein n=1 Tax=Thermocatellispora tengchongensis TaxID=1073253 RepID=A0A840P2X0_9ACTN|nr:hypothetical protein [Thermocatellispora tengchongensis]MBB5132221.1 hypothetical protein [Thermocatellispora tengchongensis]
MRDAVKRSILLLTGIAVETVGAVATAAGVAGMVSWPPTAWSGWAFGLGMTLMIPGFFLIFAGLWNQALRGVMSGAGAESTAGGGSPGGIFGLIKDMTGGNTDLLTGGVPASAVILAMRDTGVTINDQPMVVFDLEVRREGADAYRVSHREPLPRLLVGAVLPGAHLPVRLDPADPARLTIDWQRAASHPTPGERVSAADILARGVPATATVLATFSTNGMTADNGDPVIGLVLLVTGPDARPYEVRLAHRVPPHHLPLTTPGTRVPARIAPEDPQKVAIDWDAAVPTPQNA